jgi:hypothetical protein
MKLPFFLSLPRKSIPLKGPRLPLKGGDKIILGGGDAKGFKAQVQDQ